MILDDLFEQKPLPAHIKASDLPPAMRQRLTMRDVEKERPRGAYRYRVTPRTPGESPKDFLDLPGAEQYAQATGGRVQPLEEQADDPDIQRGMINLNTIEKQLNTNMKVVLQNETGRPAYQIELPVDKQWLITHAQEWIDAGKANDLYKLMGTNKGFEFLLAAWQKEDLLRDKRARDVKPEEPDLFGASQAGSPKSPRYQDESQHDQKKNPEITEAPQGARGRTERMMSQMRARQPQATSDLEALAYELQDAERRDAEEINKLEREVDSLETDIKSELQKRVATLTRRKGGVQQAAAADTKIDATLDQLTKVNDQQQRDIDDLTRAVASLGTRSGAVRMGGGRGTAQPADATAAPAAPARTSPPVTTRSRAIDQAVADLTRQADKKTAMGGDVEVTDKGLIHRGKQAQGDKQDQGDVVQNVAKTLVPDTTQGQTDFRTKFAVNAAGEEKAALKRAESVAEGWWQQFKGDVNAVAGLYGKARARQTADQQAQRAATKVAPKTSLSPWQSFKQGYTAASSPAQSSAPVPPAQTTMQAVTPATPTPAVSTTQQAAQDSTAQAFGQAPATKGWKEGDPINLRGQLITAKDPNYQRYVQLLKAQGNIPENIHEKKKPQPTNPDLWGRAKSAARSKFDVYPSAYANAWAAKWYKSKGGGWRMGKPKKK